VDAIEAPIHRQFDFQTHSWHANRVSIAPLADLPGRPCPIAAALEVVGERWALLVVGGGALGAHQVRESLGGNKTLEQARVVTRVPYQSAPPRDEYRLTASGQALIPVLDALLAWGKEHAVAADDPERPRSYRTFAEQAERQKETS
jgi:DNA-binding HxlR family transcriptional regulator